MTLFTAIRKVSETIDITQCFDEVATSPVRCLIDSCSKGNYTVAAWNPQVTVKSMNSQTTVETASPIAIEKITIEPSTTLFDVLDAVLASLPDDLVRLPNEEVEIPFLDAFFGFIGYELAWQIEKLPEIDSSPYTDANLFLPGHLIVVDERSSVTYFVTREATELDAVKALDALVNEVLRSSSPTKADADRINRPMHSTEELLSDWTSDWSKEEYIRKVERVREYIAAGDIFQANLSQGFRAPFHGDEYEFYRLLRRVNPAAYASFIQTDDVTICSVSPELFVEWGDGCIVTKPIKGTQPRGDTQPDDERNRQFLASSEKDRAELVMIVDVERNDFHRFCDTGSVKVPELFALESHPTVWHQYATVEGQFNATKVTPGQILKSIFPGGSITGAPKIRSMEIIHELEDDRRGVYTGAIGYVSPRGIAMWNIPIRTMTIAENEISFRVGGGITWYSDAELEYAETLAKGRGMMLAYSLWKQRVRAGVQT